MLSQFVFHTLLIVYGKVGHSTAYNKEMDKHTTLG